MDLAKKKNTKMEPIIFVYSFLIESYNVTMENFPHETQEFGDVDTFLDLCNH